MARRFVAIVAIACLASGCEIDLTIPQSAPASNPIAPGAINITNTNTNTTGDRSDTAPASSPGVPNTPGGVPLPLPAYGETVARSVAAANPSLLANSCQTTTGESAWQFLDLVIRTLRAQDQRWGYLCKDANCVTVAADIVAYKATSTDTGIWIVDVIGNHCPGPTDVVEVRWGVLPFETSRRWSGVRIAGVFP